MDFELELSNLDPSAGIFCYQYEWEPTLWVRKQLLILTNLDARTPLHLPKPRNNLLGDSFGINMSFQLSKNRCRAQAPRRGDIST